METTKVKRGRQGEGGGPKTDRGKAISATNAIKTGAHIKRFDRFKELAGDMKICVPCGSEQQAQCRETKECPLIKNYEFAYWMAHKERKPEYIEGFTLEQLARMEVILNYRLNWVIENMGESEIFTDRDGNVIEKPKVQQGAIYEIVNTLKTLNKTPEDLNLTRKSLETIDVEYANLLTAEIDPAKADAHKKRVLDSIGEWRKQRGQAEDMRQLDQTIQEFIAQEDKTTGNHEKSNRVALPSPFNGGDNGNSEQKQD